MRQRVNFLAVFNRFAFWVLLVRLAVSVEYTYSIPAEGLDSSNVLPGYNTQQSDGEAPVMLELWRMLSFPSLLLLPRPLWPRVDAPDMVLSMGWIKMFDI